MDTFKICKVLSVSDDKDTDTIKVRFEPDDDKITTLEGLPECFPLLPKQYFIKPKVGEAVLVFTNNPENAYSHRFYIGPLISQSHKLNKDETLFNNDGTCRPGSLIMFKRYSQGNP